MSQNTGKSDGTGARHLASDSPASVSSQESNQTQDRSSSDPIFRPLSTNYQDQRHVGKPGIAITPSTKKWEPMATYEKAEKSSSPHVPFEEYSHTSWADGSSDPKYGNTTKVRSMQPRHSTMAELKGEAAVENSGEIIEMEGESVYPKAWPLAILIIGLCFSVFLISLDRTIITTAIPYITSEFNSSDDIGWYGSAYLLTASAFQPLYGRIFLLFNVKWSFLASITMFEIGSLVCGVAPNSLTLIVGRALAGLGSAGILTGSFVVVAHSVPLVQRPLYTAVVGLMFGVGACAGPLLGGVFTDLVTWRWCFYFNLPVGGATILTMIIFFRPPKNQAMMEKSFFYRVFELDLIGNCILLAASMMLFLALQFTGQGEPWKSAEIIGLLTGSGLIFVVFGVWQWWKADGALIPPRIIRERTVAASCAMGFCIYSAILIHSYYLPIWFQAVKGDSAISSGVNMIPYVAANAIFSLLAGIFVSKNGYFTAPAIMGCAIGTVGSGLISTINIDTSSSKWIGYEILASVGIGMAIQQGFTAVQIVLPLNEVAIGTAAVVAFQSLGGAIFVSVGNTILQSTLQDAANNGELPGVDVALVISAGSSGLRNVKTFIASIAMCGLACISSWFMEWRNVNNVRRADEEKAMVAAKYRATLEQKIIDSHRKSASESTGLAMGNIVQRILARLP